MAGSVKAASFETTFSEEFSEEGASEATGGVSTDAASGAAGEDAGVRRVLGMINFMSPCVKMARPYPSLSTTQWGR